MFEIVFLIILSIYFIFTIIVIVGASKTFPKLEDDKIPSVTIIVAARNEEKNILSCIKSLEKLEFPENKLEIVIVDDNSTDKTAEIVNEFIINKPKFKIITSNRENCRLQGKTLAIANGIRIASNEIILTTDADCEVSPTWAKRIASYYVDDSVALVNGMTNQLETNDFTAMQSVDFIYLLTTASGAINMNKPMSCIGNNMSYRKSIYHEVGGYEGLEFSVTEDFSLLMAIDALKKYKIIYPIDKEALVTSKACNTIKELYHQKKRWAVGGLESKLYGLIVIGAGFLANLAVLISPFLFSKAIIPLVAFKFMTDYFFVAPVHQKLGLTLKLKHFLLFEIYFMLYVVITPIILIFSRKVTWKEREYV